MSWVEKNRTINNREGGTIIWDSRADEFFLSRDIIIVKKNFKYVLYIYIIKFKLESILSTYHIFSYFYFHSVFPANKI